MTQIKDIALTKTVADAADFLILQNPLGETYKISLANFLAGTGTSGTGTNTDQYFSDVSLLMPFNGSITDVKGHSISATGSPAIITTSSAYGGSSLAFTGAEYLEILQDVSLTFASNKFTWEAYLRPTQDVSGANNMVIMGNAIGGGSGNAGIYLGINAGHLIVRHWINGNSNALSTGAIAPGAWSHVACCSINGVTNVFLNGIMGTAGSIEQPNTDGNFYIGTVIGNGGYATNLIGDLNWLRVTNGQARYTANFTPPVLPFAIA